MKVCTHKNMCRYKNGIFKISFLLYKNSCAFIVQKVKFYNSSK